MYYSKIKKLIFPFVIVIVFILFPVNNILADTIDSGKCGEDLTWTLSEDGKLTIHGSGAMTNLKSIDESPWYDYRSDIKSIVIENGVTTIGSYSFDCCYYLNSVSIPDTVTTIGRAAFFSCDNLTSIIIPNSVTYLGDSAFSYCSSLSDISLSENLSKIEYSCFFNCTSLTNITIPNGVEELGYYCFRLCSNLENVDIPESVISIRSGAFTGCSSLNEIIIPYSVTSIGYYAFSGCSNLKSVVLNRSAYNQDAFPALSSSIFHYYFNISYINDGHGTISGKTISYGTESIDFEVVPIKDYTIDKIVWSDNNTSIELKPDDNGKYAMPDSDNDVVIKAYFKPIPPLSIICQPLDSNEFIGNNALFHVDAEGVICSYQWQVYKNGTWKNTSLLGATTDTLSVEVIESRNGMQFRCVIKDIKGNKINSNVATLTVNTICFTSQPKDYAGPIGDNAKFTIVAAGNNLKYQWQVFKNGVWKNTSLSGNKTATLEVAIMESRDGMKFRCVVTDVNGKSLYSDEATLTVAVPAVTITSEPEDCSGPVGDTAVFTVIAEGEELTYQWQVYKSGAWKNTSLTGNKTSTLEVGILDSRNGMKFRCIVKDANGNTATSNEAVLTVAAKAVSIISEPEDYSGPVGEVATFEIEAEGENLSYQWQVYKNGAWKNTSLSGNTTSSLDVEITEARDGMTFRCVVTDGNGKKATSDEVKIIVAAECSLQIVSEPESYTGSVGDTAMFEVVAEGENLTYQWQVYKNGAWKNTSLAGNNTSSLAVEVTTARNGMTFRCVVTNGEGFSVTSDEVKVLVDNS